MNLEDLAWDVREDELSGHTARRWEKLPNGIYAEITRDINLAEYELVPYVTVGEPPTAVYQKREVHR